MAVTLDDLSLPTFDIAGFKTEIEDGLNGAISALAFVQKYGGLFLPAAQETELAELVKVLTGLDAIVAKV